jgi:hypothetical protein
MPYIGLKKHNFKTLFSPTFLPSKKKEARLQLQLKRQQQHLSAFFTLKKE